jgi:hypothetical protein
MGPQLKQSENLGKNHAPSIGNESKTRKYRVNREISNFDNPLFLHINNKTIYFGNKDSIELF